MTTKKTTDEFVEQALSVHGNLYDYRDVVYKNTHSKVTIHCKVHGPFQQVAKDHLNGRGCKFCAGKGGSLEYFIGKSQVVHHNKYDYSMVEYIGCTTAVDIICPKHGKFSQKPIYHTTGSGCQKCARELTSASGVGWSKGRYIERSEESYGGYSHLYLMECYSGSESFYKVGISFKGGKSRLKYSGYKTRTLLNIRMPASVCFEAEKYLHRELSSSRYKPKEKFCGSANECYTSLTTHTIDVIYKLKEEFEMKESFSSFVGSLKKDGQDIKESLTAEKCDLLHMGFGLVLEASELGDAIKKHVIYNKPLDRENVVEELGDIMFYMEGLMQALGISGEECIEANIKKLGVRYAQGYSDKAAQQRADKEEE